MSSLLSDRIRLNGIIVQESAAVQDSLRVKQVPLPEGLRADPLELFHKIRVPGLDGEMGEVKESARLRDPFWRLTQSPILEELLSLPPGLQLVHQLSFCFSNKVLGRLNGRSGACSLPVAYGFAVLSCSRE